MNLHDFSFFKISVFDVLDVVLVALLIYQLYNLIRGTIAANIFVGLALIVIIYLLVKALDMKLLTGILGNFVNVGIIAIIVVFQAEIRRFLLLVGKNASLQRNRAWWQFFFGRKDTVKDNTAQIKPIIDACKTMKQSKTGALIVVAKYYDEQFYQNSCEDVDAVISKRLIENIFFKNSPLHDGAVIIAENKVKSAACILPLTDNANLPPQFGLRHRAGIGISEVSDAVAIIVSEETGEISFAKQGRVKMNVSFAELEKLLNKEW
ncbi:MAG: TIGR00159 family protein [Mucilaginibacter polytrichastri]|nr:TIGR00159 family protein [Mucilaginibacter polytrichastri]